MEKTIQGSLGAASAFQMTRDMKALDKQSKKILQFIFQPHQEGFREKLSRYISFEEELGAREEKHMIGLGLSIYEEGIEEGIEQGIARGIELKLFLQVCKKLAKGKTTLEIAEALEEPEDVIQTLCEKAMLYAPEYDEEKIREDWHSGQL